MNIYDYLTKTENISKAEVLEVVKFATSSIEAFDQLWLCMVHAGRNYRLCQHAAWCLSIAVERQPGYIVPHLPELVNQLSTADGSAALIRNCLRILRDIEVPAALHEKVIYSCFEFAENPLQPIAIRSFALEILGHIALIIPDIQNEILALIDYHYDNGSSGFKSSARKVQKMLQKK